MNMEKDQSVIKLMEMLQNTLGKDAFVIEDHWDSDRFAIGIASPNNRKVLAYINTEGQPLDRYFVELELPPKDPTNDVPYENAGSYESVDWDTLVGLIEKHFKAA